MATGVRSRRRWIVFGVVVALLAFGAWLVDRQLEPQRLTATVLGRLGTALKLDIAFTGTPDYAFRPEPRLRVPNLVVTDPATGVVVLRAQRLDVSLPWSTVRGGPVVITRLDLQQPVLDVAGVRRWIAARPKAPFTLPTLTAGLGVRDGTLLGDGWALRALALDLPRLAQDRPADATYGFRFQRAATDLHVRGRVHLAHAALASTFALDGGAALARADAPIAASFAFAGDFASTDAAFALRAERFHVAGKAPVPQLDGRLQLTSARDLRARFDGTLADWPEGWPALPPPLGEARGPFPLALRYRGAADFSAPLALGFAIDGARLGAATRVAEMMAWLDQPHASPLPPLTGHLTLPQLDMEGITLRGVRVDMDEGAAGDSADERAAPPVRGR
jgi:hypothetical protein